MKNNKELIKNNKPDLPWDIKTLTLSLGGIDDDKGFIKFSVFDDKYFSIRDGGLGDDGENGNCAWIFDDINIDAARRLRDFLIYAVPKDS